MRRRVGVVVLAALAVAGCSGSDEVTAGDPDRAGASDPDEIVARAVEEVLGDGSFRSRTTGAVQFVGVMEGTYDQSGQDLFEFSKAGSFATATAVVEDVAYEWNSIEQSWTDTPVESFDPLIYPGFGFTLALAGVFETATSDDVESADEMPAVATGWAEVEGGSADTRRFELEIPSTNFTGGGFSEDAPVERLEEEVIIAAFYEHAQVTAVVDVDSRGNLVRYTLRSVFDGVPGFADCAPLERASGTMEAVTEFSDVGVEFPISVPTPAEAVARFPALGEQPDISDELYLDDIDAAFRNDAGERDVAGCPTP